MLLVVSSLCVACFFFFSSRRRHTRCALVTGVQTCALPICERLPVAWTLASGDTARDIDEAERMLDLRRHNVFKLKIGARPVAEDIAHVPAITRALGDRGAVPVDATLAWTPLRSEARPVGKECVSPGRSRGVPPPKKQKTI